VVLFDRFATVGQCVWFVVPVKATAIRPFDVTLIDGSNVVFSQMVVVE
jgi:hypothetical protein